MDESERMVQRLTKDKLSEWKTFFLPFSQYLHFSPCQCGNFLLGTHILSSKKAVIWKWYVTFSMISHLHLPFVIVKRKHTRKLSSQMECQNPIIWKVKNLPRKSHELPPFLFCLIAMKKKVDSTTLVLLYLCANIRFLSLLSLLVVKGTELILIESFWFLSRFCSTTNALFFLSPGTL